MNKNKVKEELRSIGKRCFTNCFKKALEEHRGGKEFTPGDIPNLDPKINEEARKRTGRNATPGSLSSRCSKISRILENGHGLTALDICATAKIGVKMQTKAKELRARYSQKNS